MARFRLRPPVVKLVENDVEKQCLDILRYRGLRPVRLQSGTFQTKDGRWLTIGEPGLPDYCVPEFFVETKRPGGKLEETQKSKIWELEKMWGLHTIVVADVNDLIAWLDKRQKR